MPYVDVWAAEGTWMALRKARVTQPELETSVLKFQVTQDCVWLWVC